MPLQNNLSQLGALPANNSRNRVKINQDEFFMLPINCSICNGTICHKSQYGRITFELPCGCKFGKACIDAWILVSGKCPVCYVKVDHKLTFQTQERELHRYREESVYENARRNALEKIGICREVAGCMVAASELASDALKSAANSVAKSISSAADADVKEDNTTGERNKFVENAKVVTEVAAKATGYVATTVGKSLWLLGGLLAPTVRATSKQIFSEWNVDEEKADRMVNGAMEITKAVALSTANVLKGLGNANAVVGSSLVGIYGHNDTDVESDVGEIAANTV